MFTLPGSVEHVKAIDSFNVLPVLPEPLHALRDLAMNLRWSWREQAHNLFRSIDPALWSKTGHNPITMLQQLPASRMEELARDESFLHRLNEEVEDLHSYLGVDRWFAKSTAGTEDAETSIAYFSMEFGVHQSLPIYSGGLGVLAGDHLKSASDLGVPLIGIGMLYTYGYFSQTLSPEGWQEEVYEAHPPHTLAVTPVLDEQDEQVQVSVQFPGNRTANVLVWKAAIGRITLLLLDTNVESNPEDFRIITDRLYGGDVEHRIQQELVLGIGGVRAVQRYCDINGIAHPDVYHMNEGHAGFLGVERIGQMMNEGEDWQTALSVVRASTLFTTHTPVPAGIDRFENHLVERYLQAGEEGRSQLTPGVPVHEVMALGAEDDPTRFNMAHLGLRLAQYANGVAKLHGVVSRGMFKGLYPNFDEAEVPITSITNGVHTPTWTRSPIKPIVNALAGGEDLATVAEWKHTEAVSADQLWAVRNELRAELVTRARGLLATSWQQRGAQEAELGWTKNILDPNALTVGFARRVSTYKRLTLMLQQPDRLRRILLNKERPVQFVIAGKAHPADMGGKQLLQELVRFADDAGVRDRIVFIPDYNISMGKFLVAGSDIWLNNPVRPQEASGTSGMKAVMNGCLTLSISDGWWDEVADDELGWTIPTAPRGDDQQRDHWEAQALYDMLEHEVVPMFFDRDENGIPQEWIAKVRRSMSQIGARMGAERMVRDYCTELYLPAGRSARLAADRDRSRGFAQWKQHVAAHWNEVRVVSASTTHEPANAGTGTTLQAEVDLGALQASDVSVQVVYGQRLADGELTDVAIVAMDEAAPGTYRTSVAIDTPGEYGYTVRVVPKHEMLRSPAELGLVSLAH